MVLFRRDRIIKYKKGPVAERTAGLRELVGCIEQHLPHREPKLMLSRPLEQLLRTDVDALRGARRKGFEDRLDALVCAYMAGYYWYWGSERCRVYGDRANGYIVCPRLPGRLSIGTPPSPEGSFTLWRAGSTVAEPAVVESLIEHRANK